MSVVAAYHEFVCTLFPVQAGSVWIFGFILFMNWYLPLYNVAFIIRMNAKGNKLRRPFNKTLLLARAARGTVSLEEYLTGSGFKHLNTCKCRCKFIVTLNNEIYICGVITWIFCHRIVFQRDLFCIFSQALNNRRFFIYFVLHKIKLRFYISRFWTLIFHGSEQLYFTVLNNYSSPFWTVIFHRSEHLYFTVLNTYISRFWTIIFRRSEQLYFTVLNNYSSRFWTVTFHGSEQLHFTVLNNYISRFWTVIFHGSEQLYFTALNSYSSRFSTIIFHGSE